MIILLNKIMGKNMSNRTERVAIANDTLEILKKGSYQNSKGETVQIGEKLAYSIKNTVHYTPEGYQ